MLSLPSFSEQEDAAPSSGACPPLKRDVRLPGKGNLDSHGARPVHLIITMIKWIRTIRLQRYPGIKVAPTTQRERRETTGDEPFEREVDLA